MLKRYETPQESHPSIISLIGLLIGLFSVLGVVVAGIFTISKLL